MPRPGPSNDGSPVDVRTVDVLQNTGLKTKKLHIKDGVEGWIPEWDGVYRPDSQIICLAVPVKYLARNLGATFEAIRTSIGKIPTDQLAHNITSKFKESGVWDILKRNGVLDEFKKINDSDSFIDIRENQEANKRINMRGPRQRRKRLKRTPEIKAWLKNQGDIIKQDYGTDFLGDRLYNDYEDYRKHDKPDWPTFSHRALMDIYYRRR